MQYWLERAGRKRLDRVDWADAPAGCRTPKQRVSPATEELVLHVRKDLREHSVLGEYGAVAIHRELARRYEEDQTTEVPSVRTLGRILSRRGVLDSQRRVRRPAPPRGWFLPEVAAGRSEMDSFDIVEDLALQGGVFVHVLNGLSLQGGLPASWPRSQITAKNTGAALLAHWREFGLPDYAKFDNDTVFQGAHQFRDTFGRVTRLCLSLGVTPVFVPPAELGFQADVESYNGRWQSKVWRRYRFSGVADVVTPSDRYVAACRQRSAARIEAAPPRRPFPRNWALDLQAPLSGTVIFLRRTDEHGCASLLGHRYLTSATWCHRLVRAEANLTQGKLRLYALRRREPNLQPLLITHCYRPPERPFRG